MGEGEGGGVRTTIVLHYNLTSSIVDQVNPYINADSKLLPCSTNTDRTITLEELYTYISLFLGHR